MRCHFDILGHILPGGHINYILQRDLHTDACTLIVNGMKDQHKERHEKDQGHQGDTIHSQCREEGNGQHTPNALMIGQDQHNPYSGGEGHATQKFHEPRVPRSGFRAAACLERKHILCTRRTHR